MSKKKHSDKASHSASAVQKANPFYKYVYLFISAVVFIIYAQTLKYDFVYLDDDLIIVDNYNKISSVSNIPASFTSQYGFSQGTPYYRPVTNISFIIDAQFGGKEPFIYHLSNIIYNILASCLLYYFLFRLGFTKGLSLFLALIFAVHPVLTNSVVWIVGRNDMLAAIFTLTSFIWLLKYLEDGSTRSLVLHSAAYLAAVFSKEVALVFPFIAAYYLFIQQREKSLKLSWSKILAAWIVPVIISQLLRVIFIPPAKNVTYGIPALIENIRALPEVLGKIIIPVDLAVLPTFTVLKTFIGSVLLLVILLLPFIVRKIEKKKYYFGITWYLAFIIPGLFILYSDQAEKFQYLDTRIYLPIIGILISFGVVLQSVKVNFVYRKEILAGAALIILFSALTIFQSAKYKNAITFAQSAVVSNPERAFFYQKLADYYFTQADYSNAIVYLKKTIEKSPGNYLHYKNLALSYYSTNNLHDAKFYLEKANSINLRDFDVLKALMRVNYELGQYKESLKYADILSSLGAKIDPGLYNDLKKLASE